MTKRCIAVAIFTLAFFCVSENIYIAEGAGTSRMSKGGNVGGGLRLVLQLPSRTYAWNSLVRVQVELDNRSQRSVTVYSMCEAVGFLGVQAIGRNGKILFPPAVGGAPSPGCPILIRQLGTGSRIVRSIYVILRSDRLRAVAEVSVGAGHGQMLTQYLKLHLVNGAPPRVRVVTGQTVSAEITPSGLVRGSLHYMEWTKCAAAGSLASFTATRFWAVARGRRLSAELCDRGSEWHAVAGWLNGPVAYINYVSH